MPGFRWIYDDGCGRGSGGDGPSPAAETARVHRYMLEILEPMGDKATGLLMYLQKCTRPGIEVDEITIHSGPDEIQRPGKMRWSPVEFTFYEVLGKGPRSPDSPRYVGGGAAGDAAANVNLCAKYIYEWWSRTMVDIRTGLHSAPSDYLKDAQLDMLDGDGLPVWTYALYDCWPSKVSPADLDYTNSAIGTINVTMRFSKCIERE